MILILSIFIYIYFFVFYWCNFTPCKKNGTGCCELICTLNGKKKASNKSYSKLNFIQKSPRAHLSISPRSNARGLERLIWLLYYKVLKLHITFNLELLPKIRINSKQASNESCSKLNFVQKSPGARTPISPGMELRPSKDWYGWNLILYWNCELHSI